MLTHNNESPGGISSGGSKGEGGRPSYGPKFSQFHAFFGKFWQYHRLAPPPGGLAHPPTGNPGSAPDFNYLVCRII